MNSLVIETLVGKLAYVGVNLLLQSRFWVFSNLHSPVGWHLTQKNLKFRQDFEAEVWLVFCCSFLVDVTKLNLGQVKILKLALAKILSLRMLTFGWDFEVNAKSRFWNLNLIKICVRTCDMNSTLGSVVPLAMFLFYGTFSRGKTAFFRTLSLSRPSAISQVSYPPWWTSTNITLKSSGKVIRNQSIEQDNAFTRSNQMMARGRHSCGDGKFWRFCFERFS